MTGKDNSPRSAPHAPACQKLTEAELALLGAAIIKPEIMTGVDLTPADFSCQSHIETWGAIQTLHEQGTPLELVTLTTALGDRLGVAGGPPFIANLIDMAQNTANPQRYIKIIKDADYSRRLARLADKVNSALHDEADPGEVESAGREAASHNLWENNTAPHQAGQVPASKVWPDFRPALESASFRSAIRSLAINLLFRLLLLVDDCRPMLKTALVSLGCRGLLPARLVTFAVRRLGVGDA